MKLLVWLTLAVISNAQTDEYHYISKGGQIDIKCRTRGSRLLRISDETGYLYLLVKDATKSTKIQGDWTILEEVSAKNEITMRIRKDSITKPTKVRCENEREQGYHHYVQFPVLPTITVNQTSGGAVKSGDSLTMSCSASGGVPTPIISWSNSFGMTYYYPQNNAVSQTITNTAITSRLTIPINQDYDLESFTCVVRQDRTKITRQLPKLKIDYPPLAATVRLDTIQDTLTLTEVNCITNGRPKPSMIFMLTNDQGTYDAIRLPYTLSGAHNGKMLKCLVKNAYGEVASDSVTIVARSLPSSISTISTTTTGVLAVTDEPTALDEPRGRIVTKSAIPKPKNITLRAAVNSRAGLTQSTSDLTPIDDQIAFGNGTDTPETINSTLKYTFFPNASFAQKTMIIAAIAVVCILTLFTLAYVLTMKIRRAQKYETYRGGGCSATSQKSHSDDELDSFNDPSVLDPELESKFKKEYYM